VGPETKPLVSAFGGRFSDGIYNEEALFTDPVALSCIPDAIGEIKLDDSSTTDKTVSLNPLPVASSVGAMNFVPAGFAGAGEMKIVSYKGDSLYLAPFSADGSGMYDIGSATLTATLSVGPNPERFIYVASGNSGFGTNRCRWPSTSRAASMPTPLDGDGNPVPGSRRDFLTGLIGAADAFIDPLTGDFLFSTTRGGGNHVVEIQGFQAVPEPARIELLATVAAGILVRTRRQSNQASFCLSGCFSKGLV